VDVMGQAILGLVTVGVMIYSLVDCWRSGDHEVRGLPRPLWFLVILVPLVGGIAWLIYGAPRGPAAGPYRRSGPRVVAPDDDPEFLRTLEQKARERNRTDAREGPSVRRNDRRRGAARRAPRRPRR